MADFEAIVVGAGCAGSVAAYELARSGKSVLLIERGNYAGASIASDEKSTVKQASGASKDIFSWVILRSKGASCSKSGNTFAKE